MSDAIIFHATVYKVQTLTDGGVRVALDLPETAIMQMAQLAECQRFGVVLDVTCKTGVEQENGKARNVAAGAKRKSEWKTAEAAGADSDT
jgi:hypothetical protein